MGAMMWKRMWRVLCVCRFSLRRYEGGCSRGEGADQWRDIVHQNHRGSGAVCGGSFRRCAVQSSMRVEEEGASPKLLLLRTEDWKPQLGEGEGEEVVVCLVVGKSEEEEGVEEDLKS